MHRGVVGAVEERQVRQRDAGDRPLVNRRLLDDAVRVRPGKFTDEPPHPEWFCVPPATARLVRETRRTGCRVIAVGTTVVRGLETAVDRAGRIRTAEGWTDAVITAGTGQRAVDGILTGWHEPVASHLAMLEAIAGREFLERSYRAAVGEGYLWHEFGDVHLIMP